VRTNAFAACASLPLTDLPDPLQSHPRRINVSGRAFRRFRQPWAFLFAPLILKLVLRSRNIWLKNIFALYSGCAESVSCRPGTDSYHRKKSDWAWCV